jgi:hypothetical protein
VLEQRQYHLPQAKVQKGQPCSSFQSKNMDQLKALVVAANFQLEVKIPLEVSISGGHGHHQAETDS